MGDWIIIIFLTGNCFFVFKEPNDLDKKLLIVCILCSMAFVFTGVTQGEESTTSSVRLSEVIRSNYSPTVEVTNAAGLINLTSILIFLVLEIILTAKGVTYLREQCVRRKETSSSNIGNANNS